MTQWQGEDQLKKALDALLLRIDGASKQIVAQGSALAISAAQRNFEGTHKKGEPHIGGSLPNIVTGDLRRSITADPMRRYATASYGLKLGPRMIYARSVEFGYNGSRGYPYFTPAIRQVTPAINQTAQRLWAQATKL
jgi:hypothetical protein